MAVTATQVLDRVEKTLLDETNVQWSRAELLDYLNAGIRYICANKPDAFTVNAAMSLTVNETKQTIPAGGYALLDVVRNMGANGTTIGKSIRQIERNHLDHTNEDWHTTTTPAYVQHFSFDKRDPKVFWIYPPRSSTWYVQVVYSGIPAEVDESGNNVIRVDDVYETPLYWYVLALTYMKNSKRGDMNKANGYLQLFGQAVGLKMQMQVAFNPTAPESDEYHPKEPK